MKTKIIILIAFFGVFGLAKSSRATIAASCENKTGQFDVQAAVNAASPGGTVTVPAGSCTWDTTVTIDKGISLVGAGSGVGGTTIKSTASMVDWNQTDGVTSNLFEVAGFKFDLDHQNISAMLLHPGNMYGQHHNFQTKVMIHDNIFVNLKSTDTSQKYIFFAGIRGVAFNNTFGDAFYPIRTANSPFSDNPFDWTPNVRHCTSGCIEWTYWEGVVFGKEDNNFWFEDNDFTITAWSDQGFMITDGQEGGRYGFRYNTFHLSGTGGQLFDMHGDYGTGAGSTHSTMGAEIYGNNFLGGSGTASMARGGRTFGFFNNFTGSFGGFSLYEEQINTPFLTYQGPKPSQYSEDINGSYFFNNRNNYTGSYVGANWSGAYSDPGEGIKFFDNASTPGVGCGNSLPGSCTTGQAYFLNTQTPSPCTDLTSYVGKSADRTRNLSGTFYRCVANAWDSGSTLLPYPHPLRNGTPTPPPPPVTYNISNFTSLVSDWLKNISNSPADVNTDGVVNAKDLGIMMSKWKK